MSRFTHFSLGVKSGLLILVRVKDLTFSNSASQAGNLSGPTQPREPVGNPPCTLQPFPVFFFLKAQAQRKRWMLRKWCKFTPFDMRRSCMFLIIVFMEFTSGSMHKMTGCLSFIMFGLVWYGVWGMVNVVWYGLVCKVWKSTVGSLALRHRQFSNLTWPEFYMALSQTNGNSRSPSISLSKHKRNIYILIQNWSVNNPGQCVKQLDTLWQILRAWNPWPSSLLPSSLSAIPHGRLLSPQGPKVNLGFPINEMLLVLLSWKYISCM